jgi:hypothetical protein
MPYIREADRKKFEVYESTPVPETFGELNYVITRLVNRFLAAGPVNYERLNGVYGAMMAAAAEFYRRVLTPYESFKLASNGDAYNRDLLP